MADNGDDKAGRKPEIAFKDFLKAAKTVFKRKGYDPGMLDRPEVVNLIKVTHAVYKDAIDTGIADNDIPEAMMRKLDHDAFMFSGFKVHHKLSEVGLSLRDDKGRVKGYDAFAHDVRKIHDTYNGAYLRAEYDFAVTSAQMAAKWGDVEAGGGRYDLQYRTAGDERVREEHAAMNGITLPADDQFWKSYYPPNGWRCSMSSTRTSSAAVSSGRQNGPRAHAPVPKRRSSIAGRRAAPSGEPSTATAWPFPVRYLTPPSTTPGCDSLSF